MMEHAWIVVAHGLFWALALASWLAIFLGLPGTFMIVGAAALLAWATGFSPLGGWNIAILLGVALLAELIEFGLGAFGARRMGSSRVGAAGAILGSLVLGMLALPIAPPLGMILGALVGAFAGAYLFELAAVRDPGRARLAAQGALWGALGGRTLKLLAALIMLLLIALRLY